jgi:hypothetical protein
MQRRQTKLNLVTFLSLCLLLTFFLVISLPGASSRTVVVGGTMSMSAHVRMVETFTIAGLDPAQLTSNSRVTYNAPVYRSDSVSGFSQTISGFGITASPEPASTTGPLTDTFGNQYNRYEWSLAGYAQNSFVITATTEFDITTTGSPVPESFDDPYPVSSSGMDTYLARTNMAQSDNAQIVSTAQSVVSGVTMEAAAVENIMDYVKTHVSSDTNPSPDAVSTLATGSGMCTNRANLALALLRAAGIPARFVNGLVCDRSYTVDFISPEGQGKMEAGWHAQELHTWIEVYYPQKGAWAGYDPYLNFGFVDQRHMKSGIALDSDVVGKNTGGLGNLLEVYSLNNGVSASNTMSLSLSQVSDSGSYSFRSLLEAPGGTGMYVLGRDMVNSPTATPTATPTRTPAPSVTPSPTATPAPAPAANATTTPTPSPEASEINRDMNMTGETGNCLYNCSGTVTDAATYATLAGATITFDGQPFHADAQGAFTIAAANGTHILIVNAPGHGNASLTLTVAGADVAQNLRLSAVADSSTGKQQSPGFEIITALTGLFIIALYRHGRT